MRRSLRNMLLVLAVAAGTLLAASCGSKSLKGKWTGSGLSSLVSYEFTAKEYTMSANVLFTTIQIKGPYHVKDGVLYTTAQQVSSDGGATWSENDGTLIPNTESSALLTFNDDGTISIDGVTYSKVE